MGRVILVRTILDRTLMRYPEEIEHLLEQTSSYLMIASGFEVSFDLVDIALSSIADVISVDVQVCYQCFSNFRG